MTHVFHRDLRAPPPEIVHGEGAWLVDARGRRYLDACGGAAVSCLGHSDARVTAAVAAQMDRVSFSHSGFFTNAPAEALARRLVEAAPAGTGAGRAMMVGSGSEAMEAALKLARQYHLERGEPERTRIVAREGSYHGNTLGALAVGGHAGRRAPYDPLLMQIGHVGACHFYRFAHADEDSEAFGRRRVAELEARLAEIDPDTVAALVIEPVGGATLGTPTPPAGHLRDLQELCDRHGILLIADEVMCGMGRCGTLYAMEAEGAHADITIVAKGLGAGYQPIAAVIVSERVVDAVEQGSGQLWNGHTYMSHAAACAGALAVLDAIEVDGLLARVQTSGERLRGALETAFGNHPHIGDIRGRGLFRSIEIVADRTTKAPFDAKLGLAPRIKALALEEGLMCYPAQGCADGTAGDHVLLAPPYTCSDAEIDEITPRLARAVDRALTEARA
ncbi:MAG: aspartate aminotransferase family protein [Pseudomonadota bacterium]